VHKLEHEKGGFAIYRGIPDTKNTYYGVKIFKLFDEELCKGQ
jgi:hypothetical protein